MSNRDSDFASFLSGFLIGGLVGAITALLLAPQSGEETRVLIRDRSVELKDKTLSSLEDAAAEARIKADELTKAAQQRAEDLRQRGQVVLEEQRARFTKKEEAPEAPAAEKKPAAKKKTTPKKKS
ncbi:MAG: YtxH domain-containing protein [Chloroflexota bacterium]